MKSLNCIMFETFLFKFCLKNGVINLKSISLKIPILLILFHTSSAHGQTKPVPNSFQNNWFVGFHVGTQMSGIKDEDFILSNYAPLLQFNAGKWFTPYLALQIGYKGYYFKYIGDEDKHPYSFWYGEAVFNLNKMLTHRAIGKGWDILLHGGAGYFYNYYYGRPNICANTGIQTSYRLTQKLHLSLDVAAVMGWDIYQGNKDILPGTTLGIVYSF